MKRPLTCRMKAFEKVGTLRTVKRKVDDYFGSSSEISKYCSAELKFQRWKSLAGGTITKLLQVKRPDAYEMVSRYIGLDIENAHLSADEALVIDGIKLPHPKNESDWALLKYELKDIVLPYYLKRNCKDFDIWCTLIEHCLNLCSEGPYEWGGVCLAEGDIVFDCGANTGLFSAVASHRGCQVFAFEPVPDVIDNYLSKTAKMNRNICVCNLAVWDKEENLEFTFIVDSHIGSCCTELLTPACMKHRRKQITVPAITLDTFVERNSVERIDFIKADIEGAERNMLRGATKILKEFAPKLSICTYHLPDDPAVLRKIITEANPKYQIVEKFKKMYAWVP